MAHPAPAGPSLIGRPPRDQTTVGLAYGITAFTIWGVMPIYFKLIRDVPALEILGHRVLWSVVFCVVMLGTGRRWAAVWAIFANRRRLAVFAATTLLLSSNWLIYIWAVNTDRLLETSLGYYINPLLNVVLGLVFFSERLRPWQWAAVALAALGVANQTWQLGTLPWISLCLAGGFGAYGLIRKIVPVDALEGLTAETMLILPAALGYLAWLATDGSVAYLTRGLSINLLLTLAGVTSALPLLFFTEAARRLKLTTLGVLQYIGPSGHFLLAVFVYGEPFTSAQLMTFACIWTALAIYTGDGWRAQRARR